MAKVLSSLLLLLIFMENPSPRASELPFEERYQSQTRDLTNWETIKFDEWTNPNYWSQDWEQKANDPLWEIKQRDLIHLEKFGLVLSCIGVCKIYRGMQGVSASHKSQIKEGDEFQTWKDSYAWLVLMDGTLLRIPPQSSITFQEINIAVNKIFMMVRLNEGALTWISRKRQPLNENENENENKGPDTDPIFLPLDLFEANHIPSKTKRDIQHYLEESDDQIKHIQIINKLMEENNARMEDKKTEVLFILPHGNLFGNNPNFYAYTQMGFSSYFKAKEEIEINLRGHENNEFLKVNLNKWQKISDEGKSISDFEEGDQIFGKIEFASERIFTILHARELIFKQKSPELFSFNPLHDQIMQKEDYQLWDSKEGSLEVIRKYDLNARINFLKEYMRRLETSHLVATNTLVKKKNIKEIIIDDRYYGLAYREYLNYIAQGYQLHKNKRPLFENYLETKAKGSVNDSSSDRK